MRRDKLSSRLDRGDVLSSGDRSRPDSPQGVLRRQPRSERRVEIDNRWKKLNPRSARWTRTDPAGRAHLCLVPHTQIHSLVRRTLETLQDVIVSLVLLLLLILSLRSIWRLGRMTLLEEASTSQLLSEIVLVLILAELYRLLIFYLSDHRISVALTIEVALVSTLRELMVKGAYDFEGLRLLGISLLLVVLGGLLALERWMGYWRNEARETDAR